MKILIIDDSGVMRRIHKGVLMEHGIAESDIIEAEDGKIALDQATAQHIDLFLVDWNMPKLNGLDFVRAIRAVKAYSATPIIMITSEAARYSVVEAIQAGVTNYVVKPIKGNALFEKIGKYLQP
jgi:two-component system, chemotaxis family, chemotaxis protein CheY